MGDSNHRVRDAVLEDLPILVSFTLLEAKEAEGIELQSAEVERGVLKGLEDPETARYWILENEAGRTIGSISVVREWSDWRGGYYWLIQSLFIRPSHRGHGLLRILLETVSEAARRAGALEIRLLVHSQNRRAVRAYLREGFVKSDYAVMAKTFRPLPGA